MSYFKKLIGDKIYLAPKGVSEEEVKKFSEWMNDFQITDYIGRTTSITTINTEREYLEKESMDDKEKNFNIVDLKDDKLIGTIGLKNISSVPRSAELGIFIGDAEYRGNGYGTEAINLLLEFGFRYLNLHSIKLSLLAVNERAHKCYQKCGFKDTGKSREAIFLNGKYYDRLNMDILETEFKGEYIRNKNVQ